MRMLIIFVMLAEVVVAFVLGAVFCLLVVASAWLYTAPLVAQEEKDHMPSFKPPSLPESLRKALQDSDDLLAVESCKWFNVIAAFLFQELRDSPQVKRFLLDKIHKEFDELMFTKREGLMLEQLTVRDYDLGSSLPVFTNAVVQRKVFSSTDAGELEEASVGVEVDYSGGFEIGIDADLVFNRVAYVAIRVVKVKGNGQLRFTTQPCTHWSFSFYEEPELVLEVESTFEGRSFHRLSSFIESKVRRWVRQKHTLPAHKTRYKPFFVEPQPHSHLSELYVHDKRLTVGRLCVEVAKCSKLLHPPSTSSTFCTLNTSSLPWQPLLGIWYSRWVEHQFSVQVTHSEATVGIRYRLVKLPGQDEARTEFVMITEVMKDSIAAQVGVKQGDIIARVNNVKVQSVAQVKKVINKMKQSRYCVFLSQDIFKRPPKHISEHILKGKSSSHQVKAPSVEAASSGTVAHSDGEGGEGRAGEGEEEWDAISLHGVKGERSLHVNNSQSADIPSLDDQDTPLEIDTLLPRDTSADEEEAVYRTEDVEVCPAPQWRQKKFIFNVGPQQHYLNVCIYGRQANEDKTTLLIGHVTVPLMDVALECLASSSGRHQQRYVLVASELIRATSSRAVLHASEGRGRTSGKGRRERLREEDEKQFVGSILLRFKHSTYHSSNHRHGKERDDGEGATPSWRQPVRHKFHAKELEGTHKCKVCNKRIWAMKGRIQVCVKCGAQCHKKCIPRYYQVSCRKHIDDLPLDDARDEEDGRQGEEEEDDMEHRSLSQLTTGDDAVKVLPPDVEMVGAWETPAELSDDERVVEESSGSENMHKSSGDEQASSESSSDKESGGEEAEVMWAELVDRMFSHLPKPERSAAVHSKIVELEAEVERAKQLVRATQTQLSLGHGHGNPESLRRQLNQHKKKLRPLQIMKRQYTLALAQMTSS